MPQPIFNLEYQYQMYLKRMKLSEATMHPEQKRQVKQAFYGACGQMLILFRDDVPELPMQQALQVMESFVDQVDLYWKREVEQYKARNQ